MIIYQAFSLHSQEQVLLLIILLIFKISKKKMARNSCKTSIKVKINQFLQANKDFSAKLEELHNFLKLYPLEIIQEPIAKAQTLNAQVKWLILLNYIIMETSSCNFDLIDCLIQNICNGIKTCSSPIDQLIFQKLVNPYKLYLQKRHFYNTPANNKDISVYQLINLIRNALSFTDVIFTIGRYIYKKNNFFAEFNIAIGKDLGNLYRRMRMNLTDEQLMENAQIIEKMNQGLFNVYYNCYFSKFTSRLAPAWIDTEKIFKKISEKGEGSKPTFQQKVKQVEETILMECQLEANDHFVRSLEDLEEEQPKSSSTIASSTEKEHAETSSRKEFINLAQTLLHEIQKIESLRSITC